MRGIGGLDRSPWLVAVGAVVLVLVGVAIGWSFGHGQRDGTHTAVGQGYSEPSEISVQASGWTYDVPVHTAWYDADGMEHFGSRPSCLPPTGSVGPVSFAWIAYHAGGATQRQVVSVDCSN